MMSRTLSHRDSQADRAVADGATRWQRLGQWLRGTAAPVVSLDERIEMDAVGICHVRGSARSEVKWTRLVRVTAASGESETDPDDLYLVLLGDDGTRCRCPLSHPQASALLAWLQRLPRLGDQTSARLEVLDSARPCAIACWQGAPGEGAAASLAPR